MATLTQSLSLDLSALSARAEVTPTARVAVKIAFVLMSWDETRRTRRSLKGLTTAQLRDIGITQDQADAEARRPFWQA